MDIFFQEKPETIFVGIGSYRDRQCTKTLQYIFGNADQPQNVYVGLCQQNNESVDQDCLAPSNPGEGVEDLEALNVNLQPFIDSGKIRMMRLPHHQAKGPTYARYLCNTLYAGEDYFFQIDSHTRLVPGWDTKLKKMIKALKKQCGKGKVILSTYPNMWHPEKGTIDDQNGVTRICKSFFNEQGMISFEGAEILQKDPEREANYNFLPPTPYVAGGFVFADGSLLKDVPFDPSLDYLFVGEEILQSVRMWTSGYDIYTPTENIAYHEYIRSEAPKIWTDQVYSDAAAFEKVKKIIGILEGDSLKGYKYGLGSARSLEDYYTFAGIDLARKEVSKNFCRGDGDVSMGINGNQKKNGLVNKIVTAVLVVILIILIITLIILWNYPAF